MSLSDHPQEADSATAVQYQSDGINVFNGRPNEICPISERRGETVIGLHCEPWKTCKYGPILIILSLLYSEMSRNTGSCSKTYHLPLHLLPHYLVKFNVHKNIHLCTHRPTFISQIICTALEVNFGWRLYTLTKYVCLIHLSLAYLFFSKCCCRRLTSVWYFATARAKGFV